MIWAPVAAAAVTGALGALHCAAMCGPLAVAGCSRHGGVNRREAASYFVARAVAYATVGAALGALGRHALCVLPTRAIGVAAALLVAAACAARGVRLLSPRARLVPLRTASRPTSAGLAASVAALLPRRGAALGVVTAVLPCGLLLPAWALAASTASAAVGALVMFAFAVASSPGLVVALVGPRLLPRSKRIPAVAQGVAWLAVAAYVAARPLLVAAGACHVP